MSLDGVVWRADAEIGRALAKLDSLEKRKIPNLLVNAVNDVAFSVRSTLRGAILASFDAPTKFTLDSVLVMKATDSNPTATIKLRDEASKGTPPVKYLEPEVRGTQRRQKRFEKALESAGILYPGEYAVPGSGARLDRYGNVPASEIVKMISQLKAFTLAGSSANATDDKRSKAKRASRQYFYVRERRGGLVRGIWIRTSDHSVKPAFIFVSKAPRYRVRLNFEDIAARQAAIEWPMAIGRRVARLQLDVI